MKQMYKLGAFVAALALALVAGGAAQATVGYGGSEPGLGGGTVVGGGAGTGGAIYSGCLASLVAPPEGFRVSVAGGASKVKSRKIDLNFAGGDATRMAVSNSASFDDVSSEYYVSSKSWTLPAGDGQKTVYVRYYNYCGASTPVISTTVTLDTSTTVSDTDSGSTGGQVLGEKITLVDQLIAKLRFGRRGDDVRTLQTELARLGYMPRGWKVTNYYGPITRNAVTRYVDSHPADIDVLIARLKLGDNHPDVRRLQAALVKLGFMPRGWRVSSYFGTATRDAIAKYNASK